MKNKWWRNEFKVGLMAVIALVLLSVMLIRASHWRFTPNGQEIRIRFDYVGGLLKKAPVHMYGMEIGRVASIELLDDKVVVTARLYSEVSIREGYQILIDTLGLVGEKYVEIINGPAGNPATTDDPLRGTNPISIGHILTKADEISTKTLKTMDFIQNFISTNEREISAGVAELKNLVAEARATLKRTMGNVDILLTKVNRLVEAAESDVSRTAAELRTFAEELNSDREEVGTLIRDITRDLDRLVTRTTPAIERSLRNLETASESLPASAEKTGRYIDELNASVSQLVAELDRIATSSNQKLQQGLDDLGRSAATLSETVDRIGRLVTEIESGRGTLGKLITDEDGYRRLDETVTAGKRAAEDVSNITRSLDHKLRFLEAFDTWKGYELSYNSLSRSLQNRFVLSSTFSDRYLYLAGLSVREGELTYDLQVGRRFGDLTARVGSIRSKAGIGLDYYPFSKRIGVLLEGVDITSRRPQMNLGFSIRLFGGWYFILGAEDLTSSDVGLNFGIRTVGR